jgi:hypothetical protein
MGKNSPGIAQIILMQTYLMRKYSIILLIDIYEIYEKVAHRCSRIFFRPF